MSEVSVLWCFNLAEGVEPEPFFRWLRHHVWSSTAKYGCRTRAFHCRTPGHAYATLATWPSVEARRAWEAAELASLPNHPGASSPWGGQVDLQMTQLEPFG